MGPLLHKPVVLAFWIPLVSDRLSGETIIIIIKPARHTMLHSGAPLFCCAVHSPRGDLRAA
jgi:hypothetical protein